MRALSILFLLFLPLQAASQQLEIHHIDVNQGDATLLVMPNGHTLLVDAGKDGDAAEIAAYLTDLNISTLDALLVTHYDSDHYGGADKLQGEGITVGEWFDRGEKQHLPASKTGQTEYQEYVAAASDVTRLSTGERIELDDSVTIVAVASTGHVRGAIGKYEIDDLDENGYSVALLVSWRGFNYFIGGDMTKEVEEHIVLEAAVGDIDVYKVSHHGAATSSSPAFLAALRPEVAVISNGSHGSYNHPRQSVLDALQGQNAVVYQTNRLADDDLENPRTGEIVGGNVADEFIADPEIDDFDGAIVITVGDVDFTVTLPARGTSRTFPIQR